VLILKETPGLGGGGLAEIINGAGLALGTVKQCRPNSVFLGGKVVFVGGAGVCRKKRVIPSGFCSMVRWRNLMFLSFTGRL